MPVQAEVTPTLVYAQKGRAISVETVLGPDALLLESFEGEDLAFDATLKTTNTAGATLDTFHVAIRVSDKNGAETNPARAAPL